MLVNVRCIRAVHAGGRTVYETITRDGLLGIKIYNIVEVMIPVDSAKTVKISRSRVYRA